MSFIRSITRRGALAAAALALASPLAFADGPIVIKFSHVVAPDTPKGKGAQRFKELVESRGSETDGWRGEVSAGKKTS